jgi:A/G-specific adenine glycosylase
LSAVVGTSQSALLDWYREGGRAHLPWRTTRNAYYTVVSEFMLQQTQVDRVVPKFEAFVARFPDFRALAAASVADVLREWKGLGYNSRAVRLQRLALAVVERFDAQVPRDEAALRSLPGVGPYTAAAIRAFAFDEDVAACDVNIRRVVHRRLYGIEFPAQADAKTLDERANELVPTGDGHDWNSAMMDLGATLCTARAPKCGECPVRLDCAAADVDAAALESLRKVYARALSPQQALAFERTTRYARGRIVDRLRDVPVDRAISLLDLFGELRELLDGRSVEDVRTIVAALERDGLVTSEESGIRLRR